MLYLMLGGKEPARAKATCCKDRDAAMDEWKCKTKIKNECIGEKVGITPIEEKLAESHLRCWFGHVRRRPTEAPNPQ